MKHSHRFSEMDVPPARGKVFKVATWPANHAENVVILATKHYGIMTHYGNNRTRPCIKPHEACPGHIAQHPLRWKGYLFIMGLKAVSRPVFLAITPGAKDELDFARGSRKDLRGLVINVYREGRNKNSPLSISGVGEYQGDLDLPKDEDVMPTLLRMWGLDSVS